MLALVLISILLVCVIANSLRRVAGPRIVLRLRLIALGACLIQLVADGPRIELIPAYAVMAVFAAPMLFELLRGKPTPRSHAAGSIGTSILRWTGIGVGTFSLLLAAALSTILHNIDFPAPSGRYAIGTIELRLTDDARDEFYTEAGDDHRQLLVRVSYPAERDTTFEDLPRDTIPGIAALITGALWPNSITHSWGAIATHARRNAPPSLGERPFPVLLYSHGMGGYPEMNTVLAEHLVSHGYIVMAINHAFLSANFRYEDGRATGLGILLSSGPHSDTEEQSRREDAIDELLDDPANASTARQAELIRERAAANPLNTRRWAAIHQLMSDDQRFLLGTLDALQADSLLAGRLDLDRVGVFGMSAGGTASHITCALDSRCDAGLNMDGFQPLLLDLPPLQRPFMHLGSEGNLALEIAHERSRARSYFTSVRGSQHPSFTDGVLTLHRLRSVGLGDQMLGTIDGQRMLDLVNEYALTFFDRHLLGQSETLLKGPIERYPEVTILLKE